MNSLSGTRLYCRGKGRRRGGKGVGVEGEDGEEGEEGEEERKERKGVREKRGVGVGEVGEEGIEERK